jgi:hypothetical protein
MAVDRKYGRVDTEHGDLPDDMPVVVLLARDNQSVPALVEYRSYCEQAGSPQRHLDLITGTIEQFMAWQLAHPDQVRVPDSERSREWMGDQV